MRGPALVAVVLIAIAGGGGEAYAALQPVTTPVTDAPIGELVQLGNRVYLGGAFAYLGPVTGSAVQLDPATGAAAGASPRFDGLVMAAVADGAGGFIVGGAFGAIDGKPHAPLARIQPDGTVDPVFDPHPDAPVTALHLANGKLYVGGFFTTVGGRSRNKLAALDPVTGAVDPAFDPNVSGGAPFHPPQSAQFAAISPNSYNYGRSTPVTRVLVLGKGGP